MNNEQQQKFQEEVTDAMDARSLPAESLPKSLQSWVDRAIRHETAESLKSTHACMIMLATTPVNEMSLMKLGWALYCVKRRNMIEMGMTKQEYCEMLEHIIELDRQMDAIVGPMREAAMKKIMASSLIVQAKP